MTDEETKEMFLKKLEALDWDYKMTKISILKWRPDITEEEADAILAEIKQERGDK